MKKLVLTVIISALSLNAAYAYQVELNGDVGYAQTSANAGDINSSSLGGNATYYFNNVTSNSGPLAEAGFINRASNVRAGYGYAQTTDTNPEIRVHAFSLGGELYVPNSNFYATANVNRPKIEGVASNSGVYNVEVGILPINNLLLTAGVASTFNLSNNQADPIIHAKYLTKIGVNDVNIEGGARFGDHNNSYNLKGDFYLDRTLSIGATYDLNTEDNFDDAYTVGINARKFIAENISVQGGVSAGNDHNGDGTFGVNVGGTYRF
jgi:hypothetical protein